jgi:SSS family solute:Na+ symporter
MIPIARGAVCGHRPSDTFSRNLPALNALAWTIVIALNGGIILFGLWKARDTHETVDWFLAARGLPWWMVGLSMFATAVDSGDYVAVAGGAYKQGLPYISAWWLGMTTGWVLVAWVILIPMYKSGMFTNCEYLEYRFGPTARIIAVLIQVQSRTNVLANVAFSLYLTFSILTGWGTQTWWLVVGIALAAAAYTASGGLKSVVVTDSLQSVVMLAAAILLWWSVWSHVGGWDALGERLDEQVAQGTLDANVAHAMTHVGGSTDPATPPILPVIGFMIVMTSYCVINQSQAMRMLAARSLWDLKMAAVLASVVTGIVLWFNVSLGLLGRAVFPDLATGDEIFPRLVGEFLQPLGGVLTGVVVAGLLAGGISTYDSIGSSLASVLTRDVYARFLVRRADDRHYLRVSRIATFLVIAFSFVYIPFLKKGMVALYLELVGVAVVPLLTIYLLGVMTRVSRSSGTVGLVAGMLLGLTRFASPVTEALFDLRLPHWWTNVWWGYVWSMLLTALAMVLASIVSGWAPREELENCGLARDMAEPEAASNSDTTSVDWLTSSRQQVPSVPDSPFPVTGRGPAWYQRPGLWTLLLVSVVVLLNLVIFW